MDRSLSVRSVADGSANPSPTDSLSRSNNGLSLLTAPKHPEPYLSIPAQALLQDNCRVHCGMVRKENKYRKWQDRYLVLHKGCLYYYKDSTDKKAQGQFSLSGYRLSNAPERSKYDWIFKLTHIQAEKRTYYFAAHSEKERSDWIEKIQQDVNEYCDLRPTYNTGSCDSSNSSGSSYGYSSEENEFNYDYPEVDPSNIEDMKQRILQHSPAAVFPGSSTDSADYCPPPEFVNMPKTSTIHSKGQLPPAVPPNKPFHQTTSAESHPSEGSVDVSKILRPNVSRGPLITNKAAVDVAKVLKQGLLIDSNQSSATAKPVARMPVTSPRSPKKPMPPPKPIKGPHQPKFPSSVMSSSADDSSDELYLELSNEPEDPCEEPCPRQSTLQRMRPDGNSFKSKSESTLEIDILPPSAQRLDYNKKDVIPLLFGYDGAYMIHSSQRGDINQSLSVCIEDKVKHYLIFCNEDGYALNPKGQRFPSILAMLQHFYQYPLPNQANARLRMPYK